VRANTSKVAESYESSFVASANLELSHEENEAEGGLEGKISQQGHLPQICNQQLKSSRGSAKKVSSQGCRDMAESGDSLTDTVEIGCDSFRSAKKVRPRLRWKRFGE